MTLARPAGGALVAAILAAGSLVMTPGVAAQEAECLGRECVVGDSLPSGGVAPGRSGPAPGSSGPRRHHVPCEENGRAGPVETRRSTGDDHVAHLAEQAGRTIPHVAPAGDHWIVQFCFSSYGLPYLEAPPRLASAAAADVESKQWTALDEAIARVMLHRPELATSPPPDSHLVAVPAWIATTPATGGELREAATDGPVTVAISATPTHLSFDPGDGRPPIECAPAPTVPDDRCSVTYDTHGTYETVTRLHYTVEWTSTIGGAGVIDDGAVTTARTELVVRQIQAVIR